MALRGASERAVTTGGATGESERPACARADGARAEAGDGHAVPCCHRKGRYSQPGGSPCSTALPGASERAATTGDATDESAVRTPGLRECAGVSCGLVCMLVCEWSCVYGDQ